MRLELSRRAEGDLDAIRDYSVDHFHPARAIAYPDAIEGAFRLILSYPEIGGTLPALEPATRSLACQRHRIYYEIEGETLRVIRILHQAMDAGRPL